jgi:threonine/homoserine/homoserine lactone efflux protein
MLARLSAGGGNPPAVSKRTAASASPIVPSVLAALAVVIPLGLGGAVSPVMLTEQTVLLAGPDGGRAGVRYAAGVVLTTFVIVVAIVLFGRAISLPTKPHLDATLDLVLGVVLVNVAVLVFVLGRRRCGSPSRKGGDDRRRASGSRQSRAAFSFGVFSMATNVTTLALIAAAAREISRADAEIAAVAVLVLVLVGLVTTPVWVPLALTRAAPGSSQRAFAALREQIARRGRVVTVGLLSAAGLFFIGRGLIRMLG